MADGGGQKDSRARRMLEQRIGFLQDALKPERPLRIVDVGANPINRPDYQDLLEIGGCEVWGFEPEESAFAALQETAGPGRHYVQRAVGRPGKGVFHHHPMTGLGSLFPVREKSVKFLGHPRWFKPEAQKSEIDLVSLDELDELPRPDLLKIDIQGGELDVIRTGRDKLSHAVCIIPEVRFYRIYDDEPLWAPLDQELHDQGFVLHKLLFAKSTVIGNSQRVRMKNPVFRNQLIDGDAVYIRNPEFTEEWEDEQLKQLAIASAGVFRSFDLTVFCLDRLVERGAVAGDVPARFMDSLPRWVHSEG
ncbi:methyltransferase, FkbM family [Jhaorihella thermophila]|uniref:Methyltransferase, FkbM family n=2 Tax=Jhaorihella thermophila TaxID=488547 RepID=A0A1H5SDI1_9RHOB|nr:methyltransferase, FkbM family [Jhaorihella thermophila]